MSKNVEMTKENKLVDIRVFGVGGGGCNAVTRMYDPKLSTVEYFILNTDKQALETQEALQLGDNRIHIGAELTRGLGAGSNPEQGRKSAEENKDQIRGLMEGADMVFVTAGMGGGTGTGAAAVIAGIAKEMGILTVGVVTKPFKFEGRTKMKNAEAGIEELEKNCDTLIIVPNDRLLSIENKNINFVEACKLADNVLKQSILGISDLIIMPGIINVDFADVCTTLVNKGTAHVGIGVGNDAMTAVIKAVDSPILETSIEGSTGLLINFSSGNVENLNLFDVTEASNYVEDRVHPEANIIFGTSVSEELGNEIKVTVIATGFDIKSQKVEPQKAQTIQAVKEETEKKEEVAPQIKKEIPSFLVKC